MHETGATIVVLEDSSTALELMQRALRLTSHYVLLTHDPREVLELAERIRIDLLIGDATLIARDPSFIEGLRSLQPQLRLLYLSRQVMSTETTLRTPFALGELASAVEQALQSAS